MSIFDQSPSQPGAGRDPTLLGHLLDLVNNPATGGLSGMVQAFHTNGLGGIISSWIGVGPNQPITADQVERVLGPDRIQIIATKLGMRPEQVSAHLAALLPQVIDRLTPNGHLPTGGALEEALAALRGKVSSAAPR